ncbi:MAG: hypothetical protein VX802_04560, partial [Pseudomonadota bacterium]|nr:hypothetical protein [Pseudomonadota bacterium]
TKRVELVAVAVAVAFNNLCAAALVDGARSIANAALVKCANTVVFIVTNPVGIGIRHTIATAHSEGIKLVAVTVAVSFRNVRASTLVDGARSVADAALVVRSDTVVDVVTDAVGIGVRCTVTATDAERVKLVAIAVAVSFRNVRTPALVNGARSVADAALVVRSDTVVDVVTDAIGIGVCRAVTATNAQGVELVAVAVAVAFWDVRTSALVDGARTVAHAALIHGAEAFFLVVADAIAVHVGSAVTATHAQGVKLIAVTVAVTFWDVRTSALIDGARTVADAALVEFADAVIDIIADAIGVLIGCAVTAALAQSVFLVAVAVAIAFWDVRTSALVNRARSVANAALVELANAVVHDIADAIGIS